MNRCLSRVLTLCSVLVAIAYSATAGRPALATAELEEKEYIESKLFPKKGKYIDWIEANKLSNQGVRLARSGRYKSAIPMFQQAIQRYSHDYAYYENLGAALHKSGNLERAESTTEMAAQMAPRRWGPWYNLGLILTKEHEYKRALTALRKARHLQAPQSKTAGINRLIAALERKLCDTPAASTTAATVTSSPSTADVTSSADSSTATTPATTTAPASSSSSATDLSASKANPDATSTTNTNANSNSNPYTTIPEISPVPTAPANTIEKGN